MPKAQSADGVMHDFPDGTAPDVIDRVMKQYAADNQPPSTMGDVASSFGRGVAKGAIGLAGLPGDVSNLVGRGVEKAGEFFGAAPREVPQLGGLPSSGDITNKVEGVAGKFEEPKTTAGKYAQSVGEFVPSAFVGPGGALTKTATTIAGGLGAEAGGELAEGTGLEPYARAAGGLIAGAGTGLAAAERGTARLNAALPTDEKIHDAAKSAYAQLAKSNTRISEQGVNELGADIRNALLDDNFRDYLAPTTFRALEELPQVGGATVGDIDGVRQLLGRIPVTNPTDREAANRAIDALDDWLANVPEQHVISGDPAFDAALLKHAQGNWAAYRKLQQFGKAERVAENRAAASGSGANKVNTQRQEIRKILDSEKQSRGLSPEAKDKMTEIVRGTMATNLTRKGGKFAPTGAVSAIPTMGAAVLGGAPAAGATALGGSLSKWLSEYLTERQMNQLDRIFREQSPIGKPIAKAQEAERESNRMVAPAAAARSALAVSSPLRIDIPLGDRLAQPGN
jgi:hypothetical protein